MLTYKITLLVFGWVALSILVGVYSRNRRVGFVGGFLLSLIFSPLLIATLLLLFQPKPLPPEENFPD